MTLLDKFIDLELIRQLPFGEKIAGSVYVTLLGMAITFVVLGIVWGFVALLSKIAAARQSKKKPTKPGAVPVQPEFEFKEDKKLIVVITAAIAASLQLPAQTIRVRDIVRTVDDTPVWGRVGRIEQLNTTIR